MVQDKFVPNLGESVWDILTARRKATSTKYDEKKEKYNKTT